MNKPIAAIFDLEGTLSNCQHRIHHLEAGNYDSWNNQLLLDTANTKVIDHLKQLHQNGFKIILSTAKEEKYHPTISRWLVDYKIDGKFFLLLSREKSQKGWKSIDVKKEHLKMLQEDFDIKYAFDDREENCLIYSDVGITTFHVQKGIPVLFQKKNPSPADYLRRAADVFEKKNSEYGNSFIDFGKIMMAFFPKGIELKTEEDFTRFAIINIKLAKMDRYCRNFTSGGHSDSLIDDSVYSQMLNFVDRSIKK